jgi:hypothetical protein
MGAARNDWPDVQVTMNVPAAPLPSGLVEATRPQE